MGKSVTLVKSVKPVAVTPSEQDVPWVGLPTPIMPEDSELRGATALAKETDAKSEESTTTQESGDVQTLSDPEQGSEEAANPPAEQDDKHRTDAAARSDYCRGVAAETGDCSCSAWCKEDLCCGYSRGAACAACALGTCVAGTAVGLAQPVVYHSIWNCCAHLYNFVTLAIPVPNADAQLAETAVKAAGQAGGFSF